MSPSFTRVPVMAASSVTTVHWSQLRNQHWCRIINQTAGFPQILARFLLLFGFPLFPDTIQNPVFSFITLSPSSPWSMKVSQSFLIVHDLDSLERY